MQDIHRIFHAIPGLDVVLVMLAHSLQCLTAAVCLIPYHTDLQLALKPVYHVMVYCALIEILK